MRLRVVWEMVWDVLRTICLGWGFGSREVAILTVGKL